MQLSTATRAHVRNAGAIAARRIARATIGAVVLGCAASAGAAGWGALFRDSVVADMNDEELRLYIDTARRALDAPEPAQKVEWHSTQSTIGGSFLVIGRPVLKGYTECRRVRSTLYSKKYASRTSVWTACKDADARWRLARAD